MLVRCRGLKPLPKGGYYELLLTKNGKPVALPADRSTSSEDGNANVRLGASYNLRELRRLGRPPVGATGATVQQDSSVLTT